jgi:hypothetical protein
MVLGERHPVTATAMLEQATALRRLGCKRPAHDLEKARQGLPAKQFHDKSKRLHRQPARSRGRSGAVIEPSLLNTDMKE